VVRAMLAAGMYGGAGRHDRRGSIIGPMVGYSKRLENRLLVDMLRSLRLSHQQRFFDRRVERVVWSPRCRTVLAVGSHGGDVYLWNYEDELRTSKVVDGCGRGGAINDMKFSRDSEFLYAVGHDGHITAHDTETGVATHTFGTKSFGSVPKQGNCCDHWFTGMLKLSLSRSLFRSRSCSRSLALSLSRARTRSLSLALSLSLSYTHKHTCVCVCVCVGLSGCEHAQCSILASDNLGYVARFDACCKLLDRWKLHKGKVSSVEYNPIDHNIFATTSVDRTCSLWDLRMLRKGANPGGKGALLQPLLSQSYGGAVTGATFSRNGQRLMVTSQDNKVSVYNVSVDTHRVSLLGGLQPGWDENCQCVAHVLLMCC